MSGDNILEGFCIACRKPITAADLNSSGAVVVIDAPRCADRILAHTSHPGVVSLALEKKGALNVSEQQNINQTIEKVSIL